MKQIDNNLSNRRNAELAAAFHALGDPTRAAIFEAIRDGCCEAGCSVEQANLTVTNIAKQFGVTLPTVSHHIKELRQSGLIRTERRGQRVYCSVEPSSVRAMAHFLLARTPLVPVYLTDRQLEVGMKKEVP